MNRYYRFSERKREDICTPIDVFSFPLQGFNGISPGDYLIRKRDMSEDVSFGTCYVYELFRICRKTPKTFYIELVPCLNIKTVAIRKNFYPEEDVYRFDNKKWGLCFTHYITEERLTEILHTNPSIQT
jgi:hypothetical protein